MSLEQCNGRRSVEAVVGHSGKESLLETWENDSGNSSGGYTADADTSDAQENESTSVSSSSLSSDDGSDIEKEILFLKKKQSLLNRAIIAMKEEENFDASKARISLCMKETTVPSIWMEAKEIIEILNRRDGTSKKDEAKTQVTPKRVRISEAKRTKRPRIDLSSVTCMSSNKFTESEGHDSHVGKRALSKTMPFHCTGPWMAKALAHCIPLNVQAHDSAWSSFGDLTVVNDPDVGLVVIPPRQFSFENGISLMDALSFTSDAQVITLSTPPFCVVHANRAFSIFSGLESKDVIGKQVENILQMSQDAITQPTSPSDHPHTLKSIISFSSKPCMISVIPITDKSRGGCTHLLIKLEDPSEGSGPTTSGDRANGQIQTKTVTIQEKRPILGAVG